ncbi:sure-like protein [Cristinia sonorae]|uniref:Sure-like protein n=1 Tax=Cristinia sonorae TaxID=1940300 RepID=A0A8K0UPM8_9AGAR|nr:sure-like protein [Cristinia sonorae]
MLFPRTLTLLCLIASTAAFSIGIGRPKVRKILLTNDDGWATAQMRAMMDALIAEGYDVVMSGTSENQSGSSSKVATPTVLNVTCEFGTCDVGSPAMGANASNPRINYVNSFPVNAAQYGLAVLTPKFFHSKPDFVVSGPNVGTNLLTDVPNSGTITILILTMVTRLFSSFLGHDLYHSGAACEAAKQGIPSAAFSGSNNSQIAYTTLLTDPTNLHSRAALIDSKLTTTFLRTLFSSSSRPILPPNITLNVNFAAIDQPGCSRAEDFKYVLTRVQPISGVNGTVGGRGDVRTCGSEVLPDELAVVHSGGCFVSVSVIDAVRKVDVDAKTQEFVLGRIGRLLSCFRK